MTLPMPKDMHAAPRELVLTGARIARTSQIAEPLTIHLRGDRIENLLPPQIRPIHTTGIDLSHHLVLPGLINAHDHLDFSLYPQLGRGPYPSWRECLPTRSGVRWERPGVPAPETREGDICSSAHSRQLG